MNRRGLYRAFCTMIWYAEGEQVLSKMDFTVLSPYWHWYITKVDKFFFEDN